MAVGTRTWNYQKMTMRAKELSIRSNLQGSRLSRTKSSIGSLTRSKEKAQKSVDSRNAGRPRTSSYRMFSPAHTLTSGQWTESSRKSSDLLNCQCDAFGATTSIDG